MERSSAELEMALAESVHRARNDLQAVISMLRLQAGAVTDPVVRSALRDTEVRVLALSRLNARLDGGMQGAKGIVDSAVFMNGLAADLRTMHFEHQLVELDVSAESHPLSALQGKPLGLILNELVINALKYAFPAGRTGKVAVEFWRQDNDYVLMVADDGIGIDLAAPPRGTGLGKRLVKALATQIGGTFEIGPGKDGGTESIIQWPGIETEQ